MVAATMSRGRAHPELERNPRDVVSMTVDQIQSKYGVGVRGAYLIKKKASAKLIDTSAVNTTQKTVVLELLFRHGQAKSIAMLRGWMQKIRPDLDPHSLVHVVWAMQKDGHVRFRERKNSAVGTEGALERIRLSPSGISEARRKFGPNKITPEPVAQPSVSQQRRLNIQNDRDMEKDVVRPLAQNQKSVIDESAHRGNGEYASTTSTPTRQTDTHAQYPLISDLFARQERITRYQQAAKLLEDDAEIAVAILDKVKISPLEDEVLRIDREFGLGLSKKLARDADEAAFVERYPYPDGLKKDPTLAR